MQRAFTKPSEWCRSQKLALIAALITAALIIRLGTRYARRATVKPTAERRNVYELFPTYVSFGSKSDHIVVPYRIVNGMIVVRAVLDGVAVDSILDTGSMPILLPKSLGKGYQRAIVGSDTTYDSQVKPATIQIALISSLSIGSYTVRRVPAVLSSTEHNSYPMLEAMPVLGTALFRSVSLTINYRSRQITIRRNANALFATRPSTGDIRFLHLRQQHMPDRPLSPLVPVTLNGVTRPFLLDTGAVCELSGNTAEFRLPPVGNYYCLFGGYNNSMRLCQFYERVPMALSALHRRVSVLGNPTPGSTPVLGYLFLKDYEVTIDSVGDRILLRRERANPVDHDYKAINIQGPYRAGATTTLPGGVTITVPPATRAPSRAPNSRAGMARAGKASQR